MTPTRSVLDLKTILKGQGPTMTLGAAKKHFGFSGKFKLHELGKNRSLILGIERSQKVLSYVYSELLQIFNENLIQNRV